jgi:hypothetical protein
VRGVGDLGSVFRFWVEGLGFGIRVKGSRVQGEGCSFKALGSRVGGSDFRACGLELRNLGIGIGVSGQGSR